MLNISAPVKPVEKILNDILHSYNYKQNVYKSPKRIKLNIYFPLLGIACVHENTIHRKFEVIAHAQNK